MESDEHAEERQESFEQALFRAAEAQIEAGHYFLAVVIAQVAVEAVAEITFMTLFNFNLPRSLQTMMDLLPDRSFQKQATRRLWTDLTGDNITKDKSLWKPYTDHTKRRNRAAHGSVFGFSGERIGREDAEASIEATRKMAAHMIEVMIQQHQELVGTEGRHAVELDNWRAIRVLSPRAEEHTATEIGRVVREAREQAGMSREDLGQAMRVAPISVARLENGAEPPRVATLVTVAQALNVTVADLVGRADLHTPR